MKVAVTSLGETIESPVDQRFGRARYFIVFDTDTQEWAVHDNKQNLNAAQGAGIQAGQKVIELGAEVVITGHCGPKAFATLRAGDVALFLSAAGTVKEVIAEYQAGKLCAMDNADVGGHFGSV